MIRIISKEESAILEKQLDDWLLKLDYNTKQNIRSLIEPFQKMVNCTHFYQIYDSSPEIETCIHCRHERPSDYTQFLAWLKSVSNTMNTTIENILLARQEARTEQNMISLFSYEILYCIFKNNFSYTDAGIALQYSLFCSGMGLVNKEKEVEYFKNSKYTISNFNIIEDTLVQNNFSLKSQMNMYS